MFEQPLKTVAIKRFLNVSTHTDLAGLYTPDMECQVTVGQNGGQRIDGDFKGKFWHGFQNLETGEIWKSFRIPWGSGSDPNFEDSPMNYDLGKYAEGIGLTGWNWKERVSQYVGFDFDAIVGHSNKHEKRLTDKELDEVKDAIAEIPWTTLRRSTSGKGLHLYVFLNNVETRNHNEHAALARSILSLLSSITGFDFKNKVDVCGYILWIWHRKMIGTNGLELLKKGTILEDIPLNWKDHLAVVSGKRKKILPTFITEEESDGFDELSGQRNIIRLDAAHKKLLEWIREHGYSSYWDADNNMLVTHTYFLAKAFEELNLKGVFKTLAQGSEAPNDQNCFAYPLRKGAWVVRRYSKGVGEADSWHQDSHGWTRCFYNQEPDFDTACRTYGGQLNDKGSFVFQEAEVALSAAKMLGAQFEIAPWASTRKTILKKSKFGKLVVDIDKADVDPAKDMYNKGFLVEKKYYQKVFSNIDIGGTVEPEVQNYDDVIRHVVSEDGNSAGWLIKSEDNWVSEPIDNAKLALEAMGEDLKDIRVILGTHVFKHWTLVNRPFEPEYPGDRKWNRDSAQFVYSPNLSEDRSFPTWKMILDHCGAGLNSALKDNDWAKRNGVINGGDYLKIWIAACFQSPLMQLPYLFFYGEQGAGKSLFYEALETIITPNGVKEANNALQSSGNFNGEIAQAVICYVNEVDLSRGKGSTETYNRIKNWVTALRLTVHPKGKTPYMIPNSSHWIQVANNPNYCPIFPGDSRITMIEVTKPEKVIAKSDLLARLKKEASDFIGEMLSIDLPSIDDRYSIPIIETEEKIIAQEANMTMLEKFLTERVFEVSGRMISFKDFYEQFIEYLNTDERHEWSKNKVSRELGSSKLENGFKISVGRINTGNAVQLINVSWDKNKEPVKRLYVKDGRVNTEN